MTSRPDPIHLMLPVRGGRGIVPACGATLGDDIAGGSYLLTLVTCEDCRASDAGRREAERLAEQPHQRGAAHPDRDGLAPRRTYVVDLPVFILDAASPAAAAAAVRGALNGLGAGALGAVELVDVETGEITTDG